MRHHLILLWITFIDGQRSDGIYPRNIAIISGQNFTFVCGNLSNKDSTQWKFHKENSYGELQLYNGSHVMEAFKDFSVETVAKHYSTLVKSNSSKSDAGIYTCIEKAKRNSLTSISSAQLIVLGNDPVCKVHKENVMDGEFLQMDCIVDYTGGISPVIKWSRSDGIDPGSHDNINTSSSNGSLISILTAQMTKEDNAVTFMANVYFSRPSSSSDKSGVYKATNAPDYNFNWTHKANVLFAPKAVVVAPKKDVYSIGDIVYCAAHGNPPPSYEWRELESSIVVSRVSSLVIHGTEMSNRTYKCTATYVSVKGEQSISTTVTIHAVKSAGPLSSGFDPVSSVTIVAGVVCVVLFLVISAVVIRQVKGRLSQNDLHNKPSSRAQQVGLNSDQNRFDTSVTPVENHEYEYTEIFDVQADRIGQTQNCGKPFESYNPAQPYSEEHVDSTEHQNNPTRKSTCYAKLGDHMTDPGPSIYDRLIVNEMIIEEERHEQIRTRRISKAPVVQERTGFEHDPTDDTNMYANAIQIVAGEKIRRPKF